MPWVRLTEDTYYYPGETNIGYHKGLIIDAGESVEKADKMATELEKMGLEIRWLINTHGHPDHCGGNAGFMKHGAKLIAADFQSIFMKDMYMSTNLIFGAEVRFYGKHKFKYPEAEATQPDMLVHHGVLELDGMKFILEPHTGHAFDQMSITTPDNVLFMGDILLTEELIKYVGSQMLFSAEKQLEDLAWLAETDCAVYVPGHGKLITDIAGLAEINRELHVKFLDEIFEYCEQPRTREQITAHMIIKYHLADSPSGSSVVNNTVGAYLMHLYAHGRMKYANKKGYTYYTSVVK